MPGHPNPRINLAWTLESAGRNQDALETYRTAHEVYPDHVMRCKGLRVCRSKAVKARREDGSNVGADCNAGGETPEWKEGAKSQRMRVR